MKRALVVVDMQNDFIGGSLGSGEARDVVERVCSRIADYAAAGGDILCTQDTHTQGYLGTQEGKKLPVIHCVKGTHGWELHPAVQAALPENTVFFEKNTFGSKELFEYLARRGYTQVELCGVCTDICVISNALGAKAFLPEAEIRVDASCCAGVTPQSHATALESMKSCQIEVEE